MIKKQKPCNDRNDPHKFDDCHGCASALMMVTKDPAASVVTTYDKHGGKRYYGVGRMDSGPFLIIPFTDTASLKRVASSVISAAEEIERRVEAPVRADLKDKALKGVADRHRPATDGGYNSDVD